ncbi:hypothetical protein GFS60_07441 (plasmid) [Rhodococcus sp. WAY2]|nr:hypothetical protein GFS60_07441 [Rhodococcus sp. WAY2]
MWAIPEVRQPRFSVVVEQDVRRIHITVHDTEPMCGFKCPGEFGAETKCVFER